MTTQTLPVGATKHHTERTLTARHKEALEIYHAWVQRARVTGGSEAKAVQIQMDDAWSWVEQTAEDLHAFRQSTRHRTAPHGRTAANTPERLHAHGKH